MADEINSDNSNEKPTFSSQLNEDTHSNFYQHIEETHPRTLSTEQNNNDSHIEETHPRTFSTEQNNDDSHIEPIQNGNHHENSLNIQLVEPRENHSNATEFIEETSPINQPPSSPSHIESVNISDQQINEQDSFHSNQNFSEQSNTFNLEDQSNISNKDDDQPNINNYQDDSNLLLLNNDTSITDTSFQIQNKLHDKSEEFKLVTFISFHIRFLKEFVFNDVLFSVRSDRVLLSID